MSIALLATGNEIVCGDTLNTNGQFIAKALHFEGLEVGRHMACSDRETDIIQCLEVLSTTHDIIIITGGLGPTSDDRTRFALAKFLQQPLVEFPEAVAFLEQWMNGRGLNAGNHQQCLFPPASVLLANPLGTAMGSYHQGEHLILMLPGPPRECLPMVTNYVVPLLSSTVHRHEQIIKWRLFGVSESEIAERLEAALVGLTCETGYRLETPYLEFKVQARVAALPAIKAIIDPIVREYIIASPEQKASELLLERVVTHQIRLSIEDEISGGILETLLRKPENSHLINFHNAANHHFHLEGLDAYWRQQEKGLTHFTMTYNNKKYESHRLMYRSATIVYAAAELVCHRINNFLDTDAD